MLRVKGVRISQMAREICQRSSECPSATANTLVALRGRIDLPSEESRSVTAAPHDSAIELVLLGGRLLRGCRSICSCGLVRFLSAPPVFRAPLRLTAETNA